MCWPSLTVVVLTVPCLRVFYTSVHLIMPTVKSSILHQSNFPCVKETTFLKNFPFLLPAWVISSTQTHNLQLCLKNKSRGFTQWCLLTLLKGGHWIILYFSAYSCFFMWFVSWQIIVSYYTTLVHIFITYL